jgi:SAM-dependent methyltransferase
MTSGMSLMDWMFRQVFYRTRLSQFDLPEHRVGWRSRENQEARFSALAGVTDLKGKAVLDLGCGLGCLHAYLKARGWTGTYTGFDLLGPMVTEASIRFPGVRFEQRDIVSDPPGETWDVVLMSGLFNHLVKDNLAQVREVVGAALPLAREALAFNILRHESGWQDPEMFYARDADIEALAQDLSPGRWRTVTGYLPEDLTVYLHK